MNRTTHHCTDVMSVVLLTLDGSFQALGNCHHHVGTKDPEDVV